MVRGAAGDRTARGQVLGATRASPSECKEPHSLHVFPVVTNLDVFFLAGDRTARWQVGVGLGE